MFQDGLDLGSKDKPPVLLIEVERLDTRAVARQHQTCAVGVPQSYRVIAFDVMDKVRTTLFVKMQDGFRIRSRSVDVTALFQAFAQRSVVVYLAVEDEPEAIGA